MMTRKPMPYATSISNGETSGRVEYRQENTRQKESAGGE